MSQSNKVEQGKDDEASDNSCAVLLSKTDHPTKHGLLCDAEAVRDGKAERQSCTADCLWRRVKLNVRVWHFPGLA